MKWILIILASLLVLYFVWGFLVRHQFYSNVFAPIHYVEFATLLLAAKKHALQHIDHFPKPGDPTDPRHFQTSVGLAGLYTIDLENDVFQHHLSLSTPGRFTATSLAGCYAYYSAELLGIPPDHLDVGISPNYVHHVTFALTPDQQNEFARATSAIPTLEQAAKFHTTCFENSHQLRYHHMHLPQANG